MLTASVDTQAEEGLAAHYRIDSIPTTVLFRGGRELSRIAGAVDAEELAAWTARLA
jgi:thioredoxin 2